MLIDEKTREPARQGERETDSARTNYKDSEGRGLMNSDFFKANRLYAYPIIQLVVLNTSKKSRYHLVARFYFALVAY